MGFLCQAVPAVLCKGSLEQSKSEVCGWACLASHLASLALCLGIVHRGVRGHETWFVALATSFLADSVGKSLSSLVSRGSVGLNCVASVISSSSNHLGSNNPNSITKVGMRSLSEPQSHYIAEPVSPVIKL